jgi:Mlc titration factor MtfA (ptsG expression regulator)
MRSADQHGISADLVAILERRWHLWLRLSEAERERMQRLIGLFLATMSWEGAQGFEVTEEMQVLVAAQACVLLLGLEIDEYPATDSVILHPGTMRLRGEHHLGGGLRSDAVMALDGQAHYRGPVLLSWTAVRAEMNAPERGRNVVLHEFAHQLDMIDGSVDGTPPFEDDEARLRWMKVCTEAFEAPPAVVRDYAFTNPAEFFSVVTETFFCQPIQLREAEPALYEEFLRYYGQDPASRTDQASGA